MGKSVINEDYGSLN